MELAPRYCRSCGSRIFVKNVCHNCNRDPLSGQNYCYDCGALTPNADSCLRCGAKYKKNSPVKPLIIIGSLLIVALAVAWFLTRLGPPPLTPQHEKEIAATQGVPETNKQELSQTHDTIVNNPVDTTTAIKPPVKDTTKKTVTNIFSSAEKNAYSITCSYFGKNQKNQVLFFISNGSGYIKMNEKKYELKRKRKGVNEAIFAGNKYEAILTIDGLIASEKEWLASCTLTIKDLIQKKTIKHKVYSTCIEL
ncbi:MAG: hypothetical protein ABIQ07_03085 [Ginsengibacter sp.]